MKFELISPFKPAGGQPEAIKKLVEGYPKFPRQTLLGITGSGKSLDYADTIMIRNSMGLVTKIPIGKFVDEQLTRPLNIGGTQFQKNNGYSIISFNPKDFTISEKPITQVSKHKESTVFKIVLDDYSTIHVTKDHNCYKFEDGEMKLCRTEELQCGDYLPTSNHISNPLQEPKYLSLIEHTTTQKFNIKVLLLQKDPNGEKLLDILKKHQKSPKNKLKQIVNQTKNRGISKIELDEYLETLNTTIEKENKNIKIISKRGDIFHPLIEITEEFLTFLGVYLAEGHNTGNEILLSNGDPNLHGQCKKYWNSLGAIYYERDYKDAAYYSKLVASCFKQFGTHAKSKKFSNIMYNFSKNQLAIMLRAYFDGDGWVESNAVLCTSASGELMFDIKNALLRFGITSRITTKKIKKYPSNTYYKLSISGKDNLKQFMENISFSITYKKIKVRSIIKDSGNTNVDVIPNCGSFIKRLREEEQVYQRVIINDIGSQALLSMVENNQRQLSKEKFMQLIVRITHQSNHQLLNLAHFNFRKIVSIEEVPSTNGYVYDIAVQDNETFMAGDGNIFVHNTFIMANVIEKVQKPTLVIAHNKILAAQLYTELKELFPKNRVEYFISYYDYYQPESYIPTSDTYIEKEATVNEQIEKMRLHAVSSLVSRKDVIIVASISCIYGLGDPEDYRNMSIELSCGKKINRQEFIHKLVAMQYERNDQALESGKFRVRGDTIDIIPAYEESIVRVELEGDSIKRMSELNAITGEKITAIDAIAIFPARQYVVPEEKQAKALSAIREELEEHAPTLDPLEEERVRKRVKYDLEMIEEMGYCNGIENYSRHFEGRAVGTPPHTLLDYFPSDFLMIIDESHQTIPQANAMYKGDYSRKKNLVDFGFRLPCAFDNRPLKFHEFEKFFHHVLFVSATPAEYEVQSSGQTVELIIRPTGLVDPLVEVRPIKGQIPDMIAEIKKTVDNGFRTLVTTLTKRMAEDLTDYLSKEGIRVRYMHSEIESLERIELVRQLRSKEFDVLVGINLLREGLDIPEVSLICILDADKEGFLRDERSLIQTIGRAARNVNGRVILYADKITKSIKNAMEITRKRREAQIEYNKKHHIVPQTIIKKIAEKKRDLKGVKHMSKADVEKKMAELEAQMQVAAENLDFENAIKYRDALDEMKYSLTADDEQKEYKRKKK